MNRGRYHSALVTATLVGIALLAGADARSTAARLETSRAADLRVVVASDGSGDFRTVQQAIDHAPLQGGGRLIVEIKPGVYRERVMVPKDRPRVTLVGLGKDPAATVITYDMSAKAAGGTFFSSTVDVEGQQFEARNLTFANTYGKGSQAVAITVHSDRAVFRRCRFTGWQDTLYAATGRQYYRNCFIAGAVDFIFGNATAVFDRCDIQCLGRGYITAQSRTSPDQTTGYVFSRCKITAAQGVSGVYLGRPWRPFSRVVYLRCRLGGFILPQGWDNWRNPANEKTAFYAEYDSKGPGADAAQRAPWAHRLTAGDAAAFATRRFLHGKDGWNPEEKAFDE